MSVGRRLGAWALTCEGCLSQSQTNQNKGPKRSVIGRRRHTRRAASVVLFTHTTEVYDESAHHGDDVRQCFCIAYPPSDDCQSCYPEPSIRNGTQPARRPFRVWRALQFAAQRPHNEATVVLRCHVCRIRSVDLTLPHHLGPSSSIWS